MKDIGYDTKKMPLGKLSKTQIAKGFEVLEEIETALKAKTKNKNKIDELSSKFYTVIPQDFGRVCPPSINNDELLQKKYDMLMVLSDIELAQSMQEKAEKDGNKEAVDVTRFYFPLIRKTDFQTFKKMNFLECIQTTASTGCKL